MPKKSNNFHFSAISIKDVVASRFRMFSKRIAKTHSETLSAMIDFFEWHNYSPHQRFAKDLSAGQELNRQRIEAHIAISKSIEKAQNIPLTNIETMLRSLFEEEVKKYGSKIIEPKPIDPERSITEKKKTMVSRMEYDRMNRKLTETHDRLQYVLERVVLVNNRFGKDFLKVGITREQLARFKQALKNE